MQQVSKDTVLPHIKANKLIVTTALWGKLLSTGNNMLNHREHIEGDAAGKYTHTLSLFLTSTVLWL